MLNCASWNYLSGPDHCLSMSQSTAALQIWCLLELFVSVVVGAFQITFRVKIHVNDVFSFFKNYFWHQHIKTIQNLQVILNFSKKKKNSNFFGNAGWTAFPIASVSLELLSATMIVYAGNVWSSCMVLTGPRTYLTTVLFLNTMLGGVCYLRVQICPQASWFRAW
jgi:hypothetical protein